MGNELPAAGKMPNRILEDSDVPGSDRGDDVGLVGHESLREGAVGLQV